MLWHQIFRHFKQVPALVWTYKALDQVHLGITVNRYTKWTALQSLYNSTMQQIQLLINRSTGVEMWHRQHNPFDNIFIWGDQAPRNNWLVRQQGFSCAKLFHWFQVSDRISTADANATRCEVLQTVHYDLLFVQDVENIPFTMQNRNNGITTCQNVLPSVWLIVDDSSILMPVPIVPSCEQNQCQLK